MVTPLHTTSGEGDLSGVGDSWERVADELRACKESQKKAWGDLDNSTLGRYLAGEVADDERGQIEREFADHPELRQLTDLVRDVLGGLEPFVSTPPAESPSVLSFTPVHRPKSRRVLPFLRRHAALVAAACLLIALGSLTPRGRFVSVAPPQDREVSHLGDAVARASSTSPGSLFTSMLTPAPVSEHQSLGALPPPEGIRGGQAGKAGMLAHDEAKKEAAGLKIVSEQKITASDAVHDQQKGRAFLRKGDMLNAERSLVRVHTYCRDRLGAQHPYTTQTAQELAGLYAPALNQARGVLSMRAKEPASPPVAGSKYADRKADDPGAALLREKIQNQTLPQVQATVVPILVRALQTASTPAERGSLVHALGNLGSASSPALPVLRECLNNAGPGEARTILVTLGSIGPKAVPTLSKIISDSNRRDIRPAKDASPYLSVADMQLVRDTLCKLQAPEALAGIADEAACLAFRDIQSTSRHLRRLAKDFGVIVLIETKAGKKPATGNVSRLKPLGNKGVYIFIDTVGSTTEVLAAPALEKAGFSAVAVRDGMSNACKKKQFDQACDAGVRLIREQAGKLKLSQP